MQHRAHMCLHMGAALLSLLAALPAWAASADALPPVQRQGTITYVRGGMSHDEAQAFADAAQHYPLTLEFAIHHVPQAALMDQVHVQIRNTQGKTVLDTMSKGPFLLANLPEGAYTVNTEYKGQALTKAVRIASAPGRPAHVVFLWKHPL